MNTFGWLVRREYWEHRGGFVLAPAVAGVVFLVLCLVALITGHQMAMSDGHVQLNGLEMSTLAAGMAPENVEQVGAALDLAMLLAAGWPFIVLAFVVFFYALGALYDDRADKSILFWASLPIGHGATVASKAVAALVLAPLVAGVLGCITALMFMGLLGVYVAFLGGNPVDLVWGPAAPLSVVGHILIGLPVYALWAMPTVGWLLFVSACARRMPFLWAVLIPIMAGVLVSWFGWGGGWFWGNIVGRLLLGTVPGMDLIYAGDIAVGEDGPTLVGGFALQHVLDALSMPGMWIGVVVGLGFMAAAAWMRGRRMET